MSKHKNQEETNGNNPFAQEIQEEEIKKEDDATNNTETEENEANVLEELENIKNQYVRLAADFDNYRKRQAQERENLLKYGAENTLKQLLPVLDTYERGMKACENIEDAQKLREHCDVIFKQLFDALNKAGLKKIETTGKEFDPNLHEAVMQTSTNEHPDNAIIEELQSGYMLADRVLRPAMVNVAVNE